MIDRRDRMKDTLRHSAAFRRTIWTVALVAFVSSVVMVVQQISDDFEGWLNGLIIAVLALAAFRPIVTNILWALRVTFILPIKWGRALGDWLDVPDDKACRTVERMNS